MESFIFKHQALLSVGFPLCDWTSDIRIHGGGRDKRSKSRTFLIFLKNFLKNRPYLKKRYY